MPADVHLVVPVGACRAFLDGKRVPFAELRARLKPLADAGADIHFQPDPKARYACVDRVLAVLRTLPRSKIGFIGNERYDPALR